MALDELAIDPRKQRVEVARLRILAFPGIRRRRKQARWRRLRPRRPARATSRSGRVRRACRARDPPLRAIRPSRSQHLRHEAKLAAPERALDHLERVDTDLCAPVAVARMEVRRSVVVEKHRNHDSEEAADRGHGPDGGGRRGRRAGRSRQTRPQLAGSSNCIPQTRVHAVRSCNDASGGRLRHSPNSAGRRCGRHGARQVVARSRR